MDIQDFRYDYHRNGVGGGGSVISFFRLTNDEGLTNEPMVAILWDREGTDRPDEAMVMRATDLASILATYLEGGTPPEHDLSMSHFRSTDYFLPSIQEAWKQESDAKWAELRAGLKQDLLDRKARKG